MAKSVIITRPQHDNETFYLHSFMKDIIEEGKNIPGLHIIDLEARSATRAKLESSAKDGARLMILNGHGTPSDVRGHNNEIILDRTNLKMTKGAIVHALACDSLIKLGKEAAKQGTAAYVGYSAKFMIPCDPTRSSSPEKDRNAYPVKKACNSTIIALLHGETVQKAVDLTKTEYKRQIRAYGNSQDDPYGDAALIGFALAWNLSFLGFEGKATASISS